MDALVKITYNSSLNSSPNEYSVHNTEVKCTVNAATCCLLNYDLSWFVSV